MSVYHTYRADGFGGTKSSKLTPLRAIRQQCKECYGFSGSCYEQIENCPSELCPLYPFRKGRDPSKRPTPKQAAAFTKNLKKARQKRGAQIARAV